MGVSQIESWSYRSEYFVKQTIYPILIYFKNLVKIATEYWADTYIKEKF